MTATSLAQGSPAMDECTLADICTLAVAECFRGDGEIMASPMGATPTLGARVAKLLFEPDLLLTDGVNRIVKSVLPLGVTPAESDLEGWMPFAWVFDTLWNGKRHVVMGCAQLDQFGNQNISSVGPWAKPSAQLLGVRGAPGNTINHVTSYWIPAHNEKVFVRAVDMVSGVGYDRVAKLQASSRRFHDIRRVVSNLGVFDFNGPEHRMRVVSLHRDVSLDEVQRRTAFELYVDAPGGVAPTTRAPTSEQIALMRRLDPKGLVQREVQGRGV